MFHPARRTLLLLAAMLCLLPATQAHAAPAPEPVPTGFLLHSPEPGAEVPRNAVVTGSLIGDGAHVGDLSAVLVVPGQPPRELTFERARCGMHAGCILLLRLGTLPAETEVSVVVTPPIGEAETFSYVTTSEIDETPPVVPDLVLEDNQVQASNSGPNGDWMLERILTFDAGAASDDGGVGGHGLFRAVGGSGWALVERQDAAGVNSIVVDSIGEEHAVGEACYAWSAWDLAGNQGSSRELCLDATITDEEAATFWFLCSSMEVPQGTPAASLIALSILGLLSLSAARRKERRPR